MITRSRDKRFIARPTYVFSTVELLFGLKKFVLILPFRAVHLPGEEKL